MKISFEGTTSEFKGLLNQAKTKEALSNNSMPEKQTYSSILIKATIDEIIRRLKA